MGIGGTIRNLAAAIQRRAEVDYPDAQGFVVQRGELEELIGELASMPAAKRGRVPGIKPDRGDVILGGALVLSTLMEAGGFEELDVTEAGLREGVFFERFLDDCDPPLFPDVRRASVENLALRYRGTRSRTSATSPGSRSRSSTSSARLGCTTSVTASASCSGPRACCTTSAPPSTTTTTTSTRAT